MFCWVIRHINGKNISLIGKTDTLEIVIKCLHRQSQIGHQSLSYSLLSWAGTTSLKRESGTISSLRDHKCLFSAFTALAEISVLMFSYSKRRCIVLGHSKEPPQQHGTVCISLIRLLELKPDQSGTRYGKSTKNVTQTTASADLAGSWFTMNILQIDDQFLTDDWDTWSHFQAYIKVFPEKCSDHQFGWRLSRTWC